MESSRIIWNLHAFSTFALFGLIWTVQLLVYPQFRNVSAGSWELYHSFHMQWITPVVGPLMLLEVGTIALLILNGALSSGSWLAWVAGPLLIGMIWASTALVSVPLHHELQSGYSAETIDQLVRTNWIRTLLWSLRAAWVASVLFRSGAAHG